MNKETLARPYAKALFSVALEHNCIETCGEALEKSLLILAHKEYQQLIKADIIQGHVKSQILIDLLPPVGDFFTAFLNLLVDNNRLSIMPQICEQFIQSALKKNNTRRAKIKTAMSIHKDQKLSIEKALAEHYEAKVQMQYEVDTSLVGGAVIHMDDDQVFDYSLSNRLQKLSSVLSN